MGYRQRQKNAARRRLLDEARRLFAEQGYEHTTVRQVAREAGMSAASVISHFESKNDLLIEILFEIKQERAAIVRELPGTGDIFSDVLEFIRIIGDFDLRYRSLVAALWAYSWHWDRSTQKQVMSRLAPSDAVLSDMLKEAERRGEITLRHGAEHAIDVMFCLYCGRLRLAFVEQQSLDELMDALARDLDVYFEGLRSCAA